MSTLEPDTPHSAPTLSAVAKLAGVSSITVSRVVRLPDLVAPETRVRVEAAMRELGYVPNQLAGALASARTRSVGVLVPTIANSIFADTVQGLSDELEPLGHALVHELDEERQVLGALLEGITGHRPDELLAQVHVPLEVAERHLRLNHPEFRGVAGGVRMLRAKGRAERVDV